MSQNSQPSNVSKHDRNFALENKVVGGVEWIDAFDPRFTLFGLGWEKESREDRNFRRIPDRAVADLSPALQDLSFCPAGVSLGFVTDSSKISVKMVVADTVIMPHMPLTGSDGAELYLLDQGRWSSVATIIPDPSACEMERLAASDMSKRDREFRLYLPLYKKIVSVEIGVDPGASVRPSTEDKGRPIVFYGTSITQGGCANTAGTGFVEVVGRNLGCDVINLGFSGSGKGEPEVAKIIREIDAEMFVLDYVANVDVERLSNTLPEFIRLIREVHPKVPIVLMGIVLFDQALLRPIRWEVSNALRDKMMECYLQRKRDGDEHLHYIDGFGLLTAGTSGFVDGVHPTSAGFIQMAQRLVPQLGAIRIREGL